MSDVLAWLEAELARVEELARAVPCGPWQWVEHNDGLGPDWEGLEGPEGPASSVLSSGDAESYGSWINRHGAFDAYLPLIQPAAVLRRVAADRQILAEHADDNGECTTCAAEGEAGGMRFLGNVPWPCRTVRLLAEAYGWAEEAR